ncbi:hypothetical protein AB0L13_43560 [Saccharopolyspora shandongensis]|uniref:hypothetical protein n=1 Tax=Saccharopolyspora shandongensis TaxID=418495 RepID=UPI00342D03E2
MYILDVTGSLPVQLVDEVTVGSSGCVKFLIAFSKLIREVNDLLFELGDAAFEVVDVVGGAESALAPGLIAEEFGELVLQQSDSGGLPVARSLALTRSACSEA